MKTPDCVLQSLKYKRDAVIVQFGAFVGNSENDPLYSILTDGYPFTGKLILVEPVARFALCLHESYKDLPNVSICEVAISNHASESAPFYMPKVYDSRPGWYQQLGSLRDDRLTALWDIYEKRTMGDFSDEVESFSVRCLTPSQLFDLYHLTHIDFLQIDVEGMESAILNAIDFKRYAISAIQYESSLMKERESTQVVEMLRGHNFIVEQSNGVDTFVYRS